MSWPAPISLHREEAALVPLSRDHAAALAAESAAGGLHKLWFTYVPAPEEMVAGIESHLAKQAQGEMTPFCVLDAEGRPAGSTTYCSPDAENRRVEIGYTWYAKRVQRSAVNTACKRMLLGHAFETLDCIAVEFCTHVLNTPSRRAIERLGAKLDGIRRAHRIMPNGTIRDTAVYSITAPEWPAIRAHLDWQLERPR
ncbi:GNAT family N-acetyltransferase [Dinoroseobacter sp. S124A]|uniref:GNAT family N-acetyltransferase n=1 Tax=Dinoroseobacter sp. S124A TaxID=3415128 RepID=UPI003C7E6D1B